MSSTLSERFKRLPEEQQLRNEESARQAKDANDLLKKSKATRQEAEKVAKEEIEKTRRMQREEIEMNPEIVDLKRRLRTAEREKDNWERKQKDLERSYQMELDSLKREESVNLNRFNSAQDEEMRLRREQEKVQKERSEKEQRYKDLEGQLEYMKREEESQILDDMEVIKGKINELESKRLNEKDFKGNLNQIQTELRIIEEQQDRLTDELSKLSDKDHQVTEDLFKAQSLNQDAKRLEEEKVKELDYLRQSGQGTFDFEKAFVESERKVIELEGQRASLQREREVFNKSIEEKAKNINFIRSEIDRLKEELIEIENSQANDSNNLYDLENRLRGTEYELKDAKDHLKNVRDEREYYLEEKKRSNEKIGQVEGELSTARKALQETENEEKRAKELGEEIRKRRNDTESLIKTHNDRLFNLNQSYFDLQNKMKEFERIDEEITNQKSILTDIQNNLSNWRAQRRGPLQEEFDSLRNWLASHPKIESIPTGRSTAAWNELERIRRRINEIQNRFPSVPAVFENPDQLKSQIGAKEEELKSRLTARLGPISPRLASQFEREAEAIMRAEIAATHERKQEAIEREASELSKLRVSIKPQVALDEEAQNRMWKLNQEGETGVIADQVLQLCQSHNITVKHN